MNKKQINWWAEAKRCATQNLEISTDILYDISGDHALKRDQII